MGVQREAALRNQVRQFVTFFHAFHFLNLNLQIARIFIDLMTKFDHFDSFVCLPLFPADQPFFGDCVTSFWRLLDCFFVDHKLLIRIQTQKGRLCCDGVSCQTTTNLLRPTWLPNCSLSLSLVRFVIVASTSHLFVSTGHSSSFGSPWPSHSPALYIDALPHRFQSNHSTSFQFLAILFIITFCCLVAFDCFTRCSVWPFFDQK
jgi:hypothetical protein